MLQKLGTAPNPVADLDENNLPTLEWLIRRTASAGPDNIHDPQEVEDILAEYGDGTERLNPKRYQV